MEGVEDGQVDAGDRLLDRGSDRRGAGLHGRGGEGGDRGRGRGLPAWAEQADRRPDPGDVPLEEP